MSSRSSASPLSISHHSTLSSQKLDCNALPVTSILPSGIKVISKAHCSQSLASDVSCKTALSTTRSLRRRAPAGMLLCNNRPEGFGPHSAIHPNLPTTCFLDVIVVPLITWLYLLLFLPVFVIAYLRARRSSSAPIKNFRSHGIITRILRVIYYFLLLAMLAMMSLQIARLVKAHLGIGLLPFTYALVLFAGLAAFLRNGVEKDAGRRWMLRGLSAFFWILLAVAMALKVAALRKEEGPYNRRGVADNYPLGDEVTDVGTMVGVEVVLAVLEVLA